MDKHQKDADQFAQHKRRLEHHFRKLKQTYANLTDDDVLFVEGKEEELVGRLQKKLGTTREEVRKLIAKL